MIDHRKHAAKRRIVLYHERWEAEVAFDEFKTHQRERTVLRSQMPLGVVREIHGLLLAHVVIHKLMFEAAFAAECAPREISFVNTWKRLRCRMPEIPRSTCGLQRRYDDLIAEISEVRLEPRHDCVNPRVITRKMSGWAKKRQKHRHFPYPAKTFRKSIVMLN